MKREPALITSAGVVGGAAGLVTAVLAILNAWGVKLTDDQVKAILGVVGVLTPLVSAWLIRRNVYSPATHEAEVGEAMQASTDALESLDHAYTLGHEEAVAKATLARRRRQAAAKQAAEKAPVRRRIPRQ